MIVQFGKGADLDSCKSFLLLLERPVEDGNYKRRLEEIKQALKERIEEKEKIA